MNRPRVTSLPAVGARAGSAIRISGFGIKQPGNWAYSILPFMEQTTIWSLGQGQAASAQLDLFGPASDFCHSRILLPERAAAEPVSLYRSTAPIVRPASASGTNVMKIDYAINAGDFPFPGEPFLGPSSLSAACRISPGQTRLSLAESPIVRSQIKTAHITRRRQQHVSDRRKISRSQQLGHRRGPWRQRDGHDRLRQRTRSATAEAAAILPPPRQPARHPSSTPPARRRRRPLPRPIYGAAPIRPRSTSSSATVRSTPSTSRSMPKPTAGYRTAPTACRSTSRSCNNDE